MTIPSPLDERWIGAALDQARMAEAEGDVPVGAIIVRQNEVLARASNRSLRDQDPTAHAELLAIREAAHVVGSWRLNDCTLYVTLEPCAMCAGAIYWAGIGRVVYGQSERHLTAASRPRSSRSPRAAPRRGCRRCAP